MSSGECQWYEIGWFVNQYKIPNLFCQFCFRRLSDKQYPNKIFPDYCLGPIYMMSRNISNKLLKHFEENSTSYVWIEDVFISGQLYPNII